MGIVQLPTQQPNMVGVLPNQKFMVTTDNLAKITTAGYLNQVSLESNPLSNTDILQIIYSYNLQTTTGTYGVFTVSITNGVITLAQASFTGDVTLPTIANNIIVSTNTTGALGNLIGTAINAGSLQAGSSGVAGTLISFPSTAAKGSLIVAGVANTGNTNTTISNAAMGQASVISIPDPAGATADFVLAPAALISGNLVKASGTAGLIVDAAFALHAGTTAAFAGGGTTNTFTTTNMTASSIVTAVILASTNSVAITKALPGTNTLAVTFSADPGAATTVSWISVTPAG